MAEGPIEEHIAGLIEAFGVPVDDTDRAIIGAAWQQFGPGMEQILTADLTAVRPEANFDPSSPPQD